MGEKNKPQKRKQAMVDVESIDEIKEFIKSGEEKLGIPKKDGIEPGYLIPVEDIHALRFIDENGFTFRLEDYQGRGTFYFVQN